MAGIESTLSSLGNLFEDTTFMAELTSHTTSESVTFDVQPLLGLVENIIHEATAIADGIGSNTQTKDAQSRSEISPLLVENHAPLPSTINEICCQITCEALHAKDVRGTMRSLFGKLSSFSWDAKAVVTLSALSVYYAENCRLAQIEESDKLLSLVSMLTGFRWSSKTIDAWTAGVFQTLTDLIKRTLEITKCIVEFQTYIKHIPLSKKDIDITASFYHVIVAILGCSIQFSGMINMSDELHGQDLSWFVKQVNEKFELISESLEKNEQTLYLDLMYRVIDCTDVVDVLNHLFWIDGTTITELISRRAEKKTVKENMNVFKEKKVLLLISDLNLSNYDLATLISIYSTPAFRGNDYEILWIPLVEKPNEETHKQFVNLKSKMPWWSLNSMTVRKATLNVMKEEWRLKQGTTTVVLLNVQGKAENKNAMTTIRIWGWEAFPFTKLTVYKLWSMQGINWFKLLVRNTMVSNAELEQYTREEELIFLYGSAEDTKKVQEIEENLNAIKTTFGISCVALNVSTKKELFWTRAESCVSSKMQKNSNVYDSSTQDLLKLYTNYKQRGGFAILAKGSSVIINTSLAVVADVLSNNQSWCKKTTPGWTFENAFKEYYNNIIEQQRCHRFCIPDMVGNVPEYVNCTKCDRTMKVTVTFECCHDEH